MALVLILQNIYNIVDLVVTSHGSCGHEYSALGVPVIICGDTYYKGFGFNIDPSSKKEYYKLLKDISVSYESKNLAGVILLSDGIYNQGGYYGLITFGSFQYHLFHTFSSIFSDGR